MRTKSHKMIVASLYVYSFYVEKNTFIPWMEISITYNQPSIYAGGQRAYHIMQEYNTLRNNSQGYTWYKSMFLLLFDCNKSVLISGSVMKSWY